MKSEKEILDNDQESERFREGYFDGFQDRGHKNRSRVSGEKTKPCIFSCVNSEEEALYRRGYLVGYNDEDQYTSLRRRGLSDRSA